MSKVDLKLDWCSYAAAKYAVEHWHYSHRMPVGKLVKIGVWEDGTFVGCIIFGLGATPEAGKQFGLAIQQIAELVRIAMRPHEKPITQMVAVAIRMLRKQCPGLRLLVSFADSAQGHHGGIYAGGNWVYIGAIPHHAYRVNGIVVHPKTLHSRYGVGGQSVPWLRANIDPGAERIATLVKHKYLYPLDAAMRAQIEPLRKPYPKRAGSDTRTRSALPAEKGQCDPDPGALESKA